MRDKDNLTHAISLACEAHSSQLYKQGEPYILHPLRVMLSLGFNATENERITAVLHDAIEDCPEEIRPRLVLEINLFPFEVRKALCLLTHSAGGYNSYIERLSSDPLARKVKIADLKDNLDTSRGVIPTSLSQRYLKALSFLERYHA